MQRKMLKSKIHRATVTDCENGTARGCPCRAVAALNGIAGATSIGPTQGPQPVGGKALELAEERRELDRRVQPRTKAVFRQTGRLR